MSESHRLSAGQASFTSSFVAMARAVYARAPARFVSTRDPHAQALIPRRMAKISNALSSAWHLGRVGRELLRYATLGLFEHLALRTSAIDAAIDEAVRAGATQVVILGAGLDARAYRLESLAAADVYEVDHPATQRYKARKVAPLATVAARLVFVPVDFARDALPVELERAGFRPQRATVWLMEGVSQYLPREALQASVRDVSALSAPGSRFIMTYQPNPGGRWLNLASGFVGKVVAKVGEPFIGIIDSEELHALLARHGFSVRSDEGSREWIARFTPSLAGSPPWPHERIVVASIARSET